jgi:hypothetical protein
VIDRRVGHSVGRLTQRNVSGRGHPIGADHFSIPIEIYDWCRRLNFSPFRDIYWWSGVLHDNILVPRSVKGLIDVTRTKLHLSLGSPIFHSTPKTIQFGAGTGSTTNLTCSGAFVLPPHTIYCPTTHFVAFYWFNALVVAF